MTAITSKGNVCARIAQRLADSVGTQRYRMWFDRSARLDLPDDSQSLRVSVPNRFVADWIGRHFRQQLCDAARAETGRDIDLNLDIDPTSFNASSATDILPAAQGEGARTSSAQGSIQSSGSPNAASAASHASVDGRDIGRPANGLQSPAAASAALRYSLDEFVVGACNELAYSASIRLVDEPDSAANPLFIHGGVGLGKTHLLQGICRRMLQKNPQARVLYTTGEQFTNEYIAALRTNRIDSFRARIRRLDLLAVDDVHFLADKEKTQREFLHCFNAVELSGARVVLASDCHPKLIAPFSEALISRCMRGMVVQIHEPDTATRIRIVAALAKRRRIPLMESVVAVIASRCQGSIREIEGALTKLQALSSLTPTPVLQAGATEPSTPSAQTTIGHALVHRLFDDPQLVQRNSTVRMDSIIHAVSQRLGILPDQIVHGGRQRPIVMARMLAIYLARQTTGMSYPEIAAALGRASHSTVICAQQRLEQQIQAGQTISVRTLAAVHGGPDAVEPMPLSTLIEQLKAAVQRGPTAKH